MGTNRSSASVPRAIRVRGARTHNLREIDVDLPLGRVVALTGVSGSGKSSLAMSVIHAEGSRRYLEGFSPYARRRLGRTRRADVDRVDHLPPTLALRQNPPVPGRRSTVGTLTESLDVLRLVFARLGTHRCPGGHPLPPSLARLGTHEVACRRCGTTTQLPTAESFAFNGSGACRACGGAGEREEVNQAALVPDESVSIADGAVASWRLSGRSHLATAVAELGVRTDVPFRDLTRRERDIVLHGPESRHEIILVTKAGRPITFTATYDNAVESVRKGASAESTETIRKRMARFLHVDVCTACGGSKLGPAALATTVAGRTIADVARLSLDEVVTFADDFPSSLPRGLTGVARALAEELRSAAAPLAELGAGYLTLDREGPTLSSGELQRIALTAAASGRGTGVLYVLDEPTIGLHPENIASLRAALRRMVADGNSVLVVDHDPDLVLDADHVIELGPGAGRDGGTVVATGHPTELAGTSATSRYLTEGLPRARAVRPVDAGTPRIDLTVTGFRNLRDVTASIPLHRLTAVTGVSGAGKTALVRDSLVPALTTSPAPAHVTALTGSEAVRQVLVVDSAPVGRNSRSTPATYTGVFDEIRRRFATTGVAVAQGWDAGWFSYNTADGRCPACEGLGEVTVDLGHLADYTTPCEDCDGTRYTPQTREALLDGRSIADVLALTVDQAVEVFTDAKTTRALQALRDVGLGYLVLGEPTPALSGGEAQRLRLAKELARGRPGTLYVLDEPSTGLHPRDVETLLGVLDRLLDQGGTVVVVEHDRDLISHADHVIDLGPGGGPAGGTVVATGTPQEVAATPASLTGHWLAKRLR